MAAHIRITERRGTIGVLKGNGENEIFQCKENFSLRIVAKVEGAKDGYIARVTRAPDNVTRYIPSHASILASYILNYSSKGS